MTSTSKKITPLDEEVNWDSSENEETSQNLSNSHSESEADSEAEPEAITESSILKRIDCRVEITYLKLTDDKAARTYITGLNLFIKDPMEENSVIKSIQKKLSTGYYKKINEDHSYYHGFNGDYKTRIQSLLINLYNIPKDKIIIKG